MDTDDNIDGLIGDNTTDGEIPDYPENDLVSILARRTPPTHVNEYYDNDFNRIAKYYSEAPFKQEVDKLTRGTQRLENGLRSIIKVESKTGVITRRPRGRLDTRGLARAAAGDSNVFQKRWYKQAQNTAVCVLTDVSSSMTVNYVDHVTDPAPMFLAATFQRVAARTLQRARVPYSLVDYHDYTVIKKSFTENITDAELDKRVILGGAICRGCTNTTTAICDAADMFSTIPLSTNVTRRIMLVVTDGDCDYGPDMVRESMAYARTQGVDAIYGIGIGDTVDLTGAGYDAHEHINATSLPTTGLNMLTRAV